MKADLQTQLQERGLTVLGFCDGLCAQWPELLNAAALLEDMSPQEADTLGASMLRVKASAGQVLIAEGEVGDWMMLILGGTVDVVKQVPTDTVDAVSAAPASPAISRVAVLRPGAAIGEMSMLDGEPRYASCIALDDVEAAVLGRLAIARLIPEHPQVASKLLVKITQLMAQRLRNTSNQVIRLMKR
ncbi:MAG: cyclic nucleotide-binding domain-containing protein [Pseudomonadota bacterium]